MTLEVEPSVHNSFLSAVTYGRYRHSVVWMYAPLAGKDNFPSKSSNKKAKIFYDTPFQ